MIISENDIWVCPKYCNFDDDMVREGGIWAQSGNQSRCIDTYFVVCACMRMHPSIHPSIHTYIHACIHAYMHACIHAYMHTCIHAYMHTCIHTLTLLLLAFVSLQEALGPQNGFLSNWNDLTLDTCLACIYQHRSAGAICLAFGCRDIIFSSACSTCAQSNRLGR